MVILLHPAQSKHGQIRPEVLNPYQNQTPTPNQTTLSTVRWKPIPDKDGRPSPQRLAYECQADELFYGGGAGGGKSDLALGLAGTAHRRSVIFRRTFPQTRDLIERSRQIYNAGNDSHAKDSYNESLHVWRLTDGRIIEFGSMQYEKDKNAQRGRPRDLYVFDEITEFLKTQYRFVIGWNRSTFPNQRCRVVVTGNPPSTAEGMWVIDYWAAWLDENHPNPAQPGELRWYTTVGQDDYEIPTEELVNENGRIVWYNRGKKYYPRSRTFIPAKVGDNPYLDEDYLAVLMAQPEPLRTQMLEGKFSSRLGEDDEFQLIPTAHVLAAIARWRERPEPDLALNKLGIDVARGGRDSTVICKNYGDWFDFVEAKGVDTDTGGKVAAMVVRELEGDAMINIDAIGVGSSPVDTLNDMELYPNAVNVGSGSDETDKTGKYRFLNLRAELAWKIKEALDPERGDNWCLPDNRKLIAHLCAPRFVISSGKIKVEAKKDIKARLGVSPDYFDALALSIYEPPVETDSIGYYGLRGVKA